jgi:tRNA(Ile)-lysidine synthase
MQSQFQNHITSDFQELRHSPFIIAISGGVDSVVLAHLCYHLGLDFAVAHCNFKLRGKESTKDAVFVEQLAKALGSEFYLKEFETEQISKLEKDSIQITARELRYSWFKDLIETTRYTYLLTAHHLNDSLETFMINLSRSTGIKGLTGIPDKNSYLRRPLLKFTREDVQLYASENNLEWREDQSNKSTKYLRNKIRHHIVPNLLELHPQFLSNFDSTLNHLRQTEQLVEEFINYIASEIILDRTDEKEIDISKLKTFRNQNIILYELLKPFGFTEWNDVHHLVQAQTGKRVESATHQLIKDREKLILVPLAEQSFENISIKDINQEIDTDGLKLVLKEVAQLGAFGSHLVYVDRAKLRFPLKVRTIKNSDYFCPFGMKGSKKLSDFLKDEKVSPHLKSSQLLLCNGNEDIIWVLGLRADDRYKVTQTTEDILKIEIIND